MLNTRRALVYIEATVISMRIKQLCSLQLYKSLSNLSYFAEFYWKSIAILVKVRISRHFARAFWKNIHKKLTLEYFWTIYVDSRVYMYNFQYSLLDILR